MNNSITSQTDTGMVSANNEDANAHNANLGIVVHAYSMGGHNAGEVASKLTVENIRKGIEDYVAFLDGELSIGLARNHLKQLITTQNSDLYYPSQTHRQPRQHLCQHLALTACLKLANNN